VQKNAKNSLFRVRTIGAPSKLLLLTRHPPRKLSTSITQQHKKQADDPPTQQSHFKAPPINSLPPNLLFLLSYARETTPTTAKRSLTPTFANLASKVSRCMVSFLLCGRLFVLSGYMAIILVVRAGSVTQTSLCVYCSHWFSEPLDRDHGNQIKSLAQALSQL